MAAKLTKLKSGFINKSKNTRFMLALLIKKYAIYIDTTIYSDDYSNSINFRMSTCHEFLSTIIKHFGKLTSGNHIFHQHIGNGGLGMYVDKSLYKKKYICFKAHSFEHTLNGSHFELDNDSFLESYKAIIQENINRIKAVKNNNIYGNFYIINKRTGKNAVIVRKTSSKLSSLNK